MRALAETVHTPIDLHLFSDMQRTAMPANFADMVLPGKCNLDAAHGWQMAHPRQLDGRERRSSAELADPKDPKRSRVRAVIAGFGTPAATRLSRLVVNGKTVATRRVSAGERPSHG